MLKCSLAKISRIETGQRSVDDDDLARLLALYDVVAGNETGRAEMLAREGRMRGWWQDYDITPDESRYIGLETAARGIDDFRSSTVPPLLQTDQFATAYAVGARSDLHPEQRARMLSLQSLRRRALAAKPFPTYRAVLDEAALHRVVGGRQVMDAQLAHLHRMAGRPHLHIRVLPFASGAHPGLDAAFTVLTFAESELPAVACVDSPANQVLIEGAGRVDRFRATFEQLFHAARDIRDVLGDIERPAIHRTTDRHRAAPSTGLRRHRQSETAS